MKKYGFYSKADESQEIIKSGKFMNQPEAIAYFTATKQLNEDVFAKMYKVVEL